MELIDGLYPGCKLQWQNANTVEKTMDISKYIIKVCLSKDYIFGRKKMLTMSSKICSHKNNNKELIVLPILYSTKLKP